MAAPYRALLANQHSPSKSAHTEAFKLTIHETQGPRDTATVQVQPLPSASGRLLLGWAWTGCGLAGWPAAELACGGTRETEVAMLKGSFALVDWPACVLARVSAGHNLPGSGPAMQPGRAYMLGSWPDRWSRA
ncbi:hypothetical protein NDU88_007394 [Pleurodeles waltl]|uniref:Uncharacterized protein n=1 Tax=Pleurodeles waltl TaxID=8319 RepID=A0AAV7VUC3_PLEWA|nr:hypothetical protein NDU88_007394 [Pleurodeles waltl]